MTFSNTISARCRPSSVAPLSSRKVYVRVGLGSVAAVISSALALHRDTPIVAFEIAMVGSLAGNWPPPPL